MQLSLRAIEIDVEKRKVKIGSEGRIIEWPFVLSEMEYQLKVHKGLTKSFERHGKGIWEGLMSGNKTEGHGTMSIDRSRSVDFTISQLLAQT